jgi:hypothetical protein
MFKSKKDSTKPVSLAMRETLFGDQDAWPPATVGVLARATEPWSSFLRAQELAADKNFVEAAKVFYQIAASPEQESRQILQAWHFLRRAGFAPPPEKAKQVLGVVVEVGMPKGLDLLAAYADHSARYWNFSGAGVVWEHPDHSLDPFIDHLLQNAAVAAQQIGPWDKERPAAPTAGIARLNILTPSGLHFGQGPIEMLTNDPMGGRIFASASLLMQRLIEASKQARPA